MIFGFIVGLVLGFVVALLVAAFCLRMAAEALTFVAGRFEEMAHAKRDDPSSPPSP